ncbi:MAG: hypothetical protein LBB18_02125 [Puniceicoccales bacterium]|nr:hypothetical protein [Puniceicoccales bacterium]
MDKLWSSGCWSEILGTAAFIPDKYFIFEEINFPPNSLKRDEIGNMAKITIENMLPFDGNNLLSGFFESENGGSATIFIASRDRLFNEIPQLKTCTYWLPEKFLHSRVCGGQISNSDECIVGKIDQDGFLVMQDHKFKLFSEEFWTAEMHCEDEKKFSKSVNLINGVCKKIFCPLLFVTSVCVLSAMALFAFGLFAKSRGNHMGKIEKRVGEIIARHRLRNEVLSFFENPSLCLEYLNIVNTNRPAKIIFGEFAMDGLKSVRISGNCDLLETLNSFLGNLKNERRISSAEVAEIASTKEKTIFNLKVEFL